MTRFFLLHKDAMLHSESESEIEILNVFDLCLKNINGMIFRPALPHNLMCNPLTGQAVSRKVRLTR